MLPVLVVKDERYALHLENVPHIESPRRVKAMQEALEDPSLQGKWVGLKPRAATEEELAWVHTRGYIKRVAQSAGKELTSFDLDTQATKHSYEAACLGVGGVFTLLDDIVTGRGKRGFACIRPPGHHAEADKAMGFCLFNNVALGARYLKERHGMKKVMIIDVDLHHGNGTQAAFYDTDEVLYVSTHHFPSYPGTGKWGEVGSGRGEGFTINIPLGKGHKDEDFARIVYFLLNPVAQAYQPEMILISCGFDLYEHDRLGAMRVTPEGYGLITFFLLAIAEKVCRGRIAFIMEGGYSIRGIRECGFRVMQELCDVSSMDGKKLDRIIGSSPRKVPSLRKVMEVHSKYWPVVNGRP